MSRRRKTQEPSELEGYKAALVGGVAVMYSRKEELRYEDDEEEPHGQA